MKPGSPDREMSGLIDHDCRQGYPYVVVLANPSLQISPIDYGVRDVRAELQACDHSIGNQSAIHEAHLIERQWFWPNAVGVGGAHGGG